jgi:hypothetical protein
MRAAARERNPCLASEVGSIPIARSINREDSIVLAPLTHLNSP